MTHLLGCLWLKDAYKNVNDKRLWKNNYFCVAYLLAVLGQYSICQKKNPQTKDNDFVERVANAILLSLLLAYYNNMWYVTKIIK